LIRSISDLDGQRLAADICIIGSGAAGLTLASELRDSGLRVIVLSGGPEQVTARAQALYRTEIAGLRMSGAEDLRFRVFGGSTRRWAGQLLPLVEEDFAVREWVPHSGWPLTLAELAPYYTRASASLATAPFPQGARPPWPRELPSIERLTGDELEGYCSLFMAKPDLARMHHPALVGSSTVELLLDASATELLGDRSSAIEQVCVRGENGERAHVEARSFVLCAGGLESARILLSAGLGNDHDLVGRFFQEHGGISVPLERYDARALGALLGLRRLGGVTRQPYLRASPALQRARRLPGANATIRFEQPAALVAGKALFRAVGDRSRRAEAPRNAGIVLRRPGPLIRAAARHFLLRRPAQEGSSTPHLTLSTEQMPNPASRVSLSEQRDELGMRRLVVDWRVGELDTKALRAWLEVLAGRLEDAGLASVDVDAAPPLEDPMALSGTLVDAGHHMGTTRMALRPEDGVVDGECRVFGVENLFVVSSSVFPTGGTSNPTLTIVALAIRLADRLRGIDSGRGQAMSGAAGAGAG
jgi:choline dehydrogenase-like flavoprotein